jgi:hypothetical protein
LEHGQRSFFTEKSTLPKVRTFLKELVALTHELDPTRPAAIGGCQRGDLDKLGDIAGYNGDGARLFINPGIPNVVTEYSSTMASRPGNYEPGWGDLVDESGRPVTAVFLALSVAQRRSRSGARSIMAASPASASGDGAWLTTSACRNARGIGIATNTITFRRRNGPSAARPPR